RLVSRGRAVGSRIHSIAGIAVPVLDLGDGRVAFSKSAPGNSRGRQPRTSRQTALQEIASGIVGHGALGRSKHMIFHIYQDGPRLSNPKPRNSTDDLDRAVLFEADDRV